jgi:hypothetical protein
MEDPGRPMRLSCRGNLESSARFRRFRDVEPKSISAVLDMRRIANELAGCDRHVGDRDRLERKDSDIHARSALGAVDHIHCHDPACEFLAKGGKPPALRKHLRREAQNPRCFWLVAIFALIAVTPQRRNPQRSRTQYAKTTAPVPVTWAAVRWWPQQSVSDDRSPAIPTSTRRLRRCSFALSRRPIGRRSLLRGGLHRPPSWSETSALQD